MIGKSLSHFRITGKLGEGGMGVVYRAEDRKLDRQVALKVLHSEFVTDEERRKRFIREARTAAAVSHPHIAAVHQIDEADGVIFIAMELVEGKTLKEIIDGRPLQPDPCLGFALEMAEGLARAHDAGIVHRDLKPENIIVGHDGHLKILDFGLAKLYESPEGPFKDGSSGEQTISAAVTREGRILGTVAYMSPEQARGLVVDARSDVFTFGILLYEMTTGKKPFQGETITDTLTAILRDVQAPVAMFNPQVPAELERIMARCLEKNPDDRYQSAGEILADLRQLKRLSDSQPVPLVSDSIDGLRPSRPMWRRPAFWAAAVMLAAAAVFTIPRAVEWLRPGTGAQLLTDSLAVLPFENLQDGEDPQRLGQILQELIIADLSELASPRVLSSQRLFDIQRQLGRSARATIDRDMATDVALRAGAATMLTGTLSQLGANWILTCQLIDVRDGTVIKSERLDGDDLYAMVDSLTGLVRKDLGSGGSGGVAVDRAVKDRTSASLNAYQAFLEGVDLLNALEFDPAVRQFEKAVEIDPSFGQAHYKLAIARWWNRSLGMKDSAKFSTGPGEDLRRLLNGEVKLSVKDRMLAEAFLDLVEMRGRSASASFEKVLARYPDEKEAWYGLGEARFHGPDGPARRIDALEPFEKAIALDPSFALAYYHLIDLYAQEGRFDEGIAKARSFIEQDPENPAWYLGWVRVAIAEGDAAATDAIIDEVLGLLGDPERQGYLLQGASEAWVVAGDLAKAEALVRKALAIETDKKKPDLIATLGGLAHARGDTHRSEKLYRKVLDSDPENEKALKGLFHLLESERRYDEASRLARDLATEHPENGGHYSRWLASAVKSGDEAMADDAWRAARESMLSGALDAHAAAGLWQARIKARMEIRDLATGQELCREALASTPPEAHAALYGLQGWVELGLGRLEEAATSFGKAEQDGKSSIDVELGLSMVDTLRGDADSALNHAGRLNELAGGNPWSRARLAEAYLRNGDEARAEEIARVDTGAWTPKEARVFLRELATAYLGAGFLERAEESIRAAGGSGSAAGDAERLAKLSWILMQRGDNDAARDVLEQGLKRTPEDGELLYALAVSDLVLGDAGAAERRLGELLSSGPVRAEGHMVRAYALAYENRFDEAVAEAERAFEMLPNRDGHAVLAWTLVDANLDVERGLRLAEEAIALPDGYYDDISMLPFTAPAEHTAGLAYLKLGRFDEAVTMLERAAALRPGREAIDDDLRQIRPMVTRRER